MKKIIQTIFFVLLLSITLNCSDTNIDIEVPQQPVLQEWLDAHPSIKASLKLENDSSPSYYYGGTLSEISYDDWSNADKEALDAAFTRSWQWLYYTPNPSELGADDFAMPLPCTYCEAQLISSPTSGPFTVIPESLGKSVYFSYVAQSLALEAGGLLNWSISASSDTELHNYFNSRSIMHRLGGTTEFFVGEPGGGGNARIKYLGRVSPATPIFIYHWAVSNNILQTTHEATVLALLQWLRENAVHFYGSATLQNMNEHWGYPSQPSAYLVIQGTIRDTETVAQHWTAGCHGTVGFIKSILKALNIPSEAIYTCGHAQIYFPTINKYMDHGDNPYNNNVIAQASKSISGVLIDSTTYTSWFSASPDYLIAPNPLCDNIARAATEF